MNRHRVPFIVGLVLAASSGFALRTYPRAITYSWAIFAVLFGLFLMANRWRKAGPRSRMGVED